MQIGLHRRKNTIFGQIIEIENGIKIKLSEMVNNESNGQT